MNYPIMLLKNSCRIDFAARMGNENQIPLDVVLDLDQFGNLLGIEVVSLLFHVGKNGLKIIARVVDADGEGLKYSYDDEADAFYFRLKKDRSTNQKEVEAQVFLNDNGEIVGLDIENI